MDLHRYTGWISCEPEARDGTVASANEGTPKIDNRPLETREEMWNKVSLTISGGTNPAETLISDFQASELREYVSLFSANDIVLLCYGSPRKQIECSTLIWSLNGVLIDGKSGNSDSKNEGIKKQKHRNIGGGGVLKGRVSGDLEIEEGRVMPKDSWSHWEETETRQEWEVQRKTFLCVLGRTFWQCWEEILKDKKLEETFGRRFH